MHVGKRDGLGFSVPASDVPRLVVFVFCDDVFGWTSSLAWGHALADYQTDFGRVVSVLIGLASMSFVFFAVHLAAPKVSALMSCADTRAELCAIQADKASAAEKQQIWDAIRDAD